MATSTYRAAWELFQRQDFFFFVTGRISRRIRLLLFFNVLAAGVWALDVRTDELLLQAEYFLMERDTQKAKWFLVQAVQTAPDDRSRQKGTLRQLSLGMEMNRKASAKLFPDSLPAFRLAKDLMRLRQALIREDAAAVEQFVATYDSLPPGRPESLLAFSRRVQLLFRIYQRKVPASARTGESIYWAKELLHFSKEISDFPEWVINSCAQKRVLNMLLADLLTEMIRELYLSFLRPAGELSSYYLDFNHYLNLLRFNRRRQTFYFSIVDRWERAPFFDRLGELYEINYLLLENACRSRLLNARRKILLIEELCVSEKVLFYYVDQYRKKKEDYWLEKLWRIVDLNKGNLLRQKLDLYLLPGLLPELGRSFLSRIEKTEAILRGAPSQPASPQFLALNLQLSNLYQCLYKVQHLLARLTPVGERLQLNKLSDIASRKQLAIIEYLESKTVYLGLYISPDRTAIQIIPKDTALRTALARCEMGNQQAVAFASQGREALRQVYHSFNQLYNKLLRPLTGDKLPASFFIIPDGALHQLSFETLVVKPFAGRRERPAFLLQSSQIRYFRSGKALTREKARTGSVNIDGLVAVAPDYRNACKPERAPEDLKGSRRELKVLAEQFFKPGYLQQLQGKQGVLSSDFHRKLVHFSMHGLLPGAGQMGGLLFTSDAGDTLQPHELTELSAAPAVAVIGACFSAGGESVPGEGPQSIGLKLLEMGTRSVIASLSALEDKATAEILSTFYHLLAEGHLGATALRDAKIRYLAEADSYWEQPFFWGGMVLYGEDFHL